MSTTILLADDHAILRAGLRAVIAAHPDFKVVGEAATGAQAVELAARLCPDIVVMDIAMPDLNGVEATRRILRHDHKTRVIALSTYQDRHFVLAMLEAGAAAYVTKAAAADELLHALAAVCAGRRYLSPAVTQVASTTGDLFQSRNCDHLTSREREILQLVAEGKSSREIADQLFLSPNTVQVHRRNLMKKLGLRNVANLTRYAVQEGLTPRPQ
jgi:DNA-binding NarL/FixJ family response regulator